MYSTVIKSLAALSLIILISYSFQTLNSTKFKCMVQLKNYEGEGAYVVASVIDKDGDYIKTLRVLGEDDEWYPDLKEWWAFMQPQKEALDGITGATIAGGERSIFTFEIDEDLMTANNKLRIETAVEDQEHYTQDLELSLDKGEIMGKYEGSGYIRYVRILGE